MLKRIMSIRGAAGQVSESVQVTSFSPDAIILEVAGLPIFPKNGEVIDLTGSVMASDMGKVKLNVYLKNELGDDIQLVNNVPLALFGMLSDYQGASAFASSFDLTGNELAGAFVKGKHMCIPLGDIVLQGDDMLTISLTGSVESLDWSIKAWVADDVTLTGEMLVTYQYVKGLDSQSFTFRNALELYSYGVTDSESTVHDYFGTAPVDYAGQLAKAQCEGKYEYVAQEHKVPFAKVWADFTNWAQDIAFTTISDLHYLVVGRSFAPERAVRVTKDIRNVTAFKQAIISDDKSKAKALGFIN